MRQRLTGRAKQVSGQDQAADQARAAQVAEQMRLIDAMCEDLGGMSRSTLARQSGVADVTITRNLYRDKKPIGVGHIAKIIDTYRKLMQKEGNQLNPIVLNYLGRSRERVVVTPMPEVDLIASRLRRALIEINKDFNLMMDDELINDIADAQAELYPLIVAEEERLGRPLSDNPDDSALIKRARFGARSRARRTG